MLEPMARKTGSHAEQTGPRVRTAALQLFSKFGYAAVSMRQIAKEVGVQAGALYTYTPDKQALLFDLMRAHMLDLLDAYGRVARKDASPHQRLEDFVRFHIHYHIDRADEVFISYMELRNLTQDHFEAIEAFRRRYEAALEDILRAGQESGVFRVSDVRVTSMAIIAMLTGVNTWFRDEGRLSREALAEIYWDMVARMISGVEVPA